MPEGPAKDAHQECIDSIQIPPQLPNILKAYTKAAMRTQPQDLLRWTYSYMRDMRDGKTPPVKDRGEAEPVQRSPAGLTPGFLRVLQGRLGPKGQVNRLDVRAAVEDLSFDPDAINNVLERTGLVGGGTNDWNKVLAVFANTINGDIAQSMRIVCEVLTQQPDGSEPYIAFSQWWQLYTYLAEVLGKNNPDTLSKVENHLSAKTKNNKNLVGPKDFIGGDCPSLS